VQELAAVLDARRQHRFCPKRRFKPGDRDNARWETMHCVIPDPLVPPCKFTRSETIAGSRDHTEGSETSDVDSTSKPEGEEPVAGEDNTRQSGQSQAGDENNNDGGVPQDDPAPAPSTSPPPEELQPVISSMKRPISQPASPEVAKKKQKKAVLGHVSTARPRSAQVAAGLASAASGPDQPTIVPTPAVPHQDRSPSGHLSPVAEKPALAKKAQRPVPKPKGAAGAFRCSRFLISSDIPCY
jgi:hypothetical protein